ncbi:MAG: hypothetical protein AB1349_03740 [Elusimicrobiota bacterium]
MSNEICESGKCSLSQEKIEFISSLQISNIATAEKSLQGMKIKFFGKNDCDICKKVIEKIHQYLRQFENKPVLNYYDLDTLDGLTEAAIYVAFDIPTIVIEKNGYEVKRWKNIPEEEEFKNVCC